MRETLAASKVVVGRICREVWKILPCKLERIGNRPALQFYNEAITTAPESKAAREAEKKVAKLTKRR